MNDFADQYLPGNLAIPTLSQLNIALAEGPSLACQGCWVAHQGLGCAGKPEQDNRRLPVETIFQVIHEALPLGLRLVRLTGGASLLYPQFDALIDRLESLELSLCIETNGAGMTASRAARLARLPQATVVLALEGADAATHDKMTGQPGSFQAITRAARALKKAGLAPQMIFVLNRQNSCQMEAAVRLAENLGAGSLRFLAALAETCVHRVPGQNGNGCNGNGRGAGLGQNPDPSAQLAASPALKAPDVLKASTLLTVEELIALGRRMERELVHTTALRLSFDLPPAFRGLHPLSRIEGQGRCEVLNQLSLLPGGEYGLCGSVSASLPTAQALLLGQAGQNALSPLWHAHPTLQLLRVSLPDELDGVCERCIMKTACLGNCAVENYLRSGSFRHAHWFCETADRVGLFPASRLIENRW